MVGKKSQEFYRVGGMLWRNLSYNERNHLNMEGVDLFEVAKEYGTPIFTYSKKQILENVNLFWDAFREYPKVILAYSTKTNLTLAILRILREAGVHAEVCSGLEYYSARKASYTPDMMLYDGMVKSTEELETTIRAGIRIINVESLEELEEINRIGSKLNKKVDVGFRLRMNGIGSSRFSFKSILGISYDRFGIDFDSDLAYSVIEKATRMKNVRVVGLHTHTGSNYDSPQPYIETIRKIVPFMKRLADELEIGIEYLNLGGGFGIKTIKQYGLGDIGLNMLKGNLGMDTSYDLSKKKYDFISMGRSIVDEIKKQLSKYSLNEPTLVFEPGRLLVANSAILITKVLLKKTIPNGRTWIIVDGGTNLIPNLLLYNEYHHMMPIEMKTDASEKISIAGPLLYSSDILMRDVVVPKLDIGDYIALMDVGAYTVALSNQFLRPRPYSILIDKNKVTIIKEKETYDDVLNKDTID